MELHEIVDPIIQIAKWSGIGFSGYVAALAAPYFIDGVISKKIESQQELEKIAKEEAKKLNMSKSFNAFLYLENEARATESNGEYSIHIGGMAATRHAIRHELYHIHRGHLDHPKKTSLLYYLFVFEPQAVLYECFGIKM